MLLGYRVRYLKIQLTYPKIISVLGVRTEHSLSDFRIILKQTISKCERLLSVSLIQVLTITMNFLREDLYIRNLIFLRTAIPKKRKKASIKVTALPCAALL